MPSVKRSNAMLYVELEPSLLDTFRERARTEGRNLRVVVERALSLYLRTPLDPEPIPPPAPKRPRGRPKKESGNNS